LLAEIGDARFFRTDEPQFAAASLVGTPSFDLFHWLPDQAVPGIKRQVLLTCWNAHRSAPEGKADDGEQRLGRLGNFLT
jgi:hypothetical protein